MSVRLLESTELPLILDDAEGAYNENYAEMGAFNREHFQKTWEYYTLFGGGFIFVEEEVGVPRATVGMVRAQNMYTGENEYCGMFVAVGKPFRGGQVFLTMMDGVHDFFASHGIEGTIYFTSRVTTLQAVWKRIGYEEDAIRYVRRVRV